MKKKVVILCLVALLAVGAILGGTVAYFTDTADQTNTFTVGNVDIELDEAVVERADNGDYVATSERTDEDQIYENLFPGQQITKDPTIENTGSYPAYIAAKVTVINGNGGDIADVIGTGYPTEDADLLGIHTLLSGGIINPNDEMKGVFNGLPIYGNDEYSVFQTIEDGNYVFYIFMEEPVAAGDVVTLFDTVTIPVAWDNEDLIKMNGLQINVEAFATQVETFDDCVDAMTTAFADIFLMGDGFTTN